MVEVARVARDRQAEGDAWAQLAFAHFTALSWDHVPHVKRCAEEAGLIAREVGDQQLLARALHHLGGVDLMHGDLPEAEGKFMEALRIGEAGGFKAVTVQVRGQIAAQAYWRGDFPAVVEICRTAEEEARDIHDGFSELFSVAFRCLAHIGQGEHTEGLGVISEGLAKARDRDNKFIIGRLTNTLGWVYQELGDFTRAIEHDREAADLGRRIKNDNVEVSSLINLGFDHLHLGEPGKALTLLEETLRRAEKGFGSHRWRWAMHVRAYLAETLITLGRPGDALGQIGQALDVAQATGSSKYTARCHLLRGEIALGAGQAGEAEGDFAEALRIARRIGYPTLTWQAAHARARALVAAGARGQGADRIEQAYEMARLATDTIQSVADRLPYPALTSVFLAWVRVREVEETLDRLRRA